MTAKLCHDVLAAVPDGTLALDEAHWVLADTLMLLASKEIKLSAATGPAEADAEEEPATNASAAAANARSKLLSQVARKAMVESVVPIVVELKRCRAAAVLPAAQPAERRTPRDRRRVLDRRA